MWIEREFSNKLIEYAREFPAVVLVGARQVGKSSLLNKLFSEYQVVSLDLPANSELARSAPESFLTKFQPPLIIDEIQYAPELLRYIKIWIDEHRDKRGQFLIIGSQKFSLMQGVSESLAGRCGVLELSPLSISEISAYKQFDLTELMFRGGYPELYQDETRNASFFYQSYLATYLERDIRTLLNVSSLRDFQRFMQACALRSGQILNKADLARDVGISAVTANEWLNLLVVSNQITLLEPYFNNPTKRMVKSPKLYFNDSGLLSSLLGVESQSDLLKLPNLRNIWENFVFIELQKFLKLHHQASSLFFWRDQYGLEVDFVILQAGYFELIEVKWAEHPTSSDIKNIDKVISAIGANNISKISIICRTQTAYPIKVGNEMARAISLTEFLSNK